MSRRDEKGERGKMEVKEGRGTCGVRRHINEGGMMNEDDDEDDDVRKVLCTGYIKYIHMIRLS